MFELNDKVTIKSNEIVGTIVDITAINGEVMYTVESDIKNISEGYDGDWKLFDCSGQDITAYED